MSKLETFVKSYFKGVKETLDVFVLPTSHRIYEEYANRVLELRTAGLWRPKKPIILEEISKHLFPLTAGVCAGLYWNEFKSFIEEHPYILAVPMTTNLISFLYERYRHNYFSK